LRIEDDEAAVTTLHRLNCGAAMSKAKNIALRILQILLCLLFLGTGISKLMSRPEVVEGFREYGYPNHFYLLAGAMETLGALALLLPRTAVYGAAVLSVVMIGATGTLLLHSQVLFAPFPFSVLILLAIVGYARRPQSMRP
jgi:putative oxidoreductase